MGSYKNYCQLFGTRIKFRIFFREFLSIYSQGISFLNSPIYDAKAVKRLLFFHSCCSCKMSKCISGRTEPSRTSTERRSEKEKPDEDGEREGFWTDDIFISSELSDSFPRKRQQPAEPGFLMVYAAANFVEYSLCVSLESPSFIELTKQ